MVFKLTQEINIPNNKGRKKIFRMGFVIHFQELNLTFIIISFRFTEIQFFYIILYYMFEHVLSIQIKGLRIIP